MSRAPALTTTSYAILGLLAVRSWTTHELVQQVDRGMRRMWPRAQSKLYEEPKKLVAHGFAEAEDDPVGRRRRTRYSITKEGRAALALWLSTPGAGPQLEFEQLLKISFADHGTTADIRANLAATRSWVLEQNRVNLEAALSYRDGRSSFPERAALNQLVGRFLTDYYAMIAEWTSWAAGVVDRWPDDATDAPFDQDIANEIVRRAENVGGLLDGGSSTV